MVGAIVGDIAGSRFEFCNLKLGLMAVAMVVASMAFLAPHLADVLGRVEAVFRGNLI